MRNPPECNYRTAQHYSGMIYEIPRMKIVDVLRYYRNVCGVITE